VVTISPVEGAVVRYTTDSSEPAETSAIYTVPFTIKSTTAVKAKAFPQNALAGATATHNVIKYQWLEPAKVKNPQPGIEFKYFEPGGKIDMNALTAPQPAKKGLASIISLDEKQRADKFAFLFEGYIRINKDGAYTFYLASDDGSKLFIDEIEIIDNDGDHGTVEKNGKAFLRKGYHKIKVMYFDSGGGNELKVSMQGEDGKRTDIPAVLLYH
jgi:hypothetical protein